MASERAARYKLESVIRGHHVYKTVWQPVQGESLQLCQENGNVHDKHAVSVIKGHEIVGHVPREFSRAVWYFLHHGGSAYCEVTGHRKRGNGLEVPCRYIFSGRKSIVCRLKSIM